jgi:hypothetical protein
MADEDKPATAKPSYDDLLAETMRLRRENEILRGEVRMRDDTIARSRKPKPRTLDPNAKSAFDRPAFSKRI